MGLLGFLFGSPRRSTQRKALTRKLSGADKRRAEALEAQKQRSFEAAYLRRVDREREKAHAAARRVRERAEREKERQRKLEDRAGKARTKSVQREVTAKASTTARKVEALESTADTIERLVGKRNAGERLSREEADQLGRAMAGGILGLRRNPASKVAVSKLLEKADADSERFHGTPDEVVELEPAERRPPSRYQTVLGDLTAIEYRPHSHSKRGDAEWRHEAGDQGILRRKAKGKELVVADPATGVVRIVKHTSSMRFEADKGIVG